MINLIIVQLKIHLSFKNIGQKLNFIENIYVKSNVEFQVEIQSKLIEIKNKIFLRLLIYNFR